MNELKELLSLVGLLSDEMDIAPPDEENGYLVYLQNGERILSLAKEKKKRTVFKNENRTVRLCDLKYPSLDPEFNKALHQIEQAIRRIKSKLKCVDSEESLLNEGIPFLLEYLPDFEELKVEAAETSYEKNLATDVTKCSQIIKVTINGESYYVPCNPKKRFSDSDYFYRSNKKHTIHVVHHTELFLPLFYVNWLNLLLDEAKEEEAIDLLLKQLATTLTYNLQKYVYRKSEIPDWFLLFLMNSGYKIKDDFIFKGEFYDGSLRAFEKTRENFSNEMRIVTFAYHQEKFMLHDILDATQSDMEIRFSYLLRDFALHSLHHIISNIQDTIEEEKLQKKMRGMIARAYTTKRNIPDYILKEMKNSQLNEYFGFIEFDEDVDLCLVDKITAEFRRLNHHHFHDFKCKNVSLRFRKLGKHHATGLYYPSISTMVVDFRHPQSFVHEYFHLIDDALGNLSLRYDFNNITMRYQYLLTKYVKDSKKEGSSEIILKGKYDLNYYLRKCEIFARCGEMYLFRNCHVISSLLKPEDTKYFCYPKDKELDALIQVYYENLLNSLKNQTTESRRVADEKNIRIADY